MLPPVFRPVAFPVFETQIALCLYVLFLFLSASFSRIRACSYELRRPVRELRKKQTDPEEVKSVPGNVTEKGNLREC